MGAMESKERTAIVTGAGSGIGRAAAVALYADGWHVVFAGRPADRLERAMAQAAAPRESRTRDRDHTPRAIAIQTDVTQPQSVHELFARTHGSFGRLDLLFNNAGIAPRPTPVEDVPFNLSKSAIDTNLPGMFLCIKQAVRLMKNQTPR